MNKLINLHAIVIIGILLIFNCNAAFTQQKQHRHKNTQGFTDIDGDGYNDNAPDHDGDGIPNGLDPDWTKWNGREMNYIDADGDGYNDNAPDHDGDGIPNGLDPDWIKGNGRRMNYIDANGDGINDLIQINKQTERENMHQNTSRDSLMNSKQERQNNHKKDESNNK